MSCPDDTREEFVNQLVHLNVFLTVLAWYERKDFFPIPGGSSESGLPSEIEAFASEICLPQALKTAQLAHAVQAGGILTDEPDWEVWEDATVGAVSAYGSLAAALEGGGPLNETDLIDAAQYFVRRATIATLTAVNKQIAEHIEGGKEPTGDREEVPHV